MIVKPFEIEYFDKTAIVAFQYAEDVGVEDYHEEHIIESIREHNINISNCWFNAMVGQQVVGFIGGGVTAETLKKEFVSIIDFLYLLPDYNNKDNLRDLVFSFIEWSKQVNSSKIFVTAELTPETKTILETDLSFKDQNILGRGI
jgi:hypothetical protein